MFEYDFMVNAFAASGIVAVLAGIVGYFLVMRGQTFAGHALSHVGFTGATGAVLIGISPIWGMIGFTLAAGVGMGALGERLAGRDVAIGVILSLALGFGLLFLHFFTAYATQVTALLFGNVLGVNASTLGVLAGLGVLSLVALAAIMRPLLFASLQPELAEAKGVSLRLVSMLFLAIAALAVARNGGAEPHDETFHRAGACGAAGAGAGVAWAHARVLYGLADQLLDHRAGRTGVWRESVGAALRAAPRVIVYQASKTFA
jgi:zinc/manganese transport system permease protein